VFDVGVNVQLQQDLVARRHARRFTLQCAWVHLDDRGLMDRLQNVHLLLDLLDGLLSHELLIGQKMLELLKPFLVAPLPTAMLTGRLFLHEVLKQKLKAPEPVLFQGRDTLVVVDVTTG
jgi:hypothetical protein